MAESPGFSWATVSLVLSALCLLAMGLFTGPFFSGAEN
jgi:hypothetical protein